ncbi:hypothetical protein, partial [Phocaeicola barnesiae]|uniref:hypothetical protein n=1 Tax=Phocaeicola barnesiae TaxID=376804 RepID=UPI001F25D195
ARLNANKQLLLNQVKNQPNITLQQLVNLIKQYEDLTPQDFQGYISDILYNQLLEMGRDPNEADLWNRIQSAPTSTLAEVQDAQRLVSTYMTQYPQGPQINDMPAIMEQLERRMRELMEEQEWKALEKGNYNALRKYRLKYPNSVHLEEIDDLMWVNTRNVVSEPNLRRYLSDWPSGRHSDEANQALGEIGEWERVKRSNDLFLVDDYRDNHPDSLFKHEVDSKYYELREDELKKMKANPSEYTKNDVDRLIEADIFKHWELIDEELMTEESWERLKLDRDALPDLQSLQVEDPNIQAPEGCTDIYLFGTPGTGKTCLLMGLVGANGSGYTMNMRKNGGPYAAALQQYVHEGITTGHTYGTFVTVISGEVTEKTKRGNVVDHRINLVEMSGEEFALRIADNKEVSLANMGTGATNLLQNNNRKVFFIIVDPTKLRLKIEYLDKVRDAEGNLIGQNVRKKYINQLDIMNKFVSLFELPENQDIMRKVDAIHFVVTKADMLGDATTRLNKARELLLSTYQGPVEQLKNYCRKTKRINYSTSYRPQVFTFSLGRFYLGDIFDFDKTETLQIVDTIRMVTSGTREMSWWNKFMKAIGD